MIAFSCIQNRKDMTKKGKTIKRFAFTGNIEIKIKRSLIVLSEAVYIFMGKVIALHFEDQNEKIMQCH